MKKVAHIILVMLLLTATGGIAVNRHFCGGNLISYSLFATPESCCGDHCSKCHNELTFNKVADEYTVTGNSAIDLKCFSHAGMFNLWPGIISDSPVARFMQEPIIDLSKFLPPKTGELPVQSGNFRC